MHVGVDIGGTKIAAGMVRNGKVVKKFVVPTGASKGRAFVISQIRNVIAELEGPDVRSVGIGVPGVYSGTRIIRTPNVPCLNGVDLRKALKRDVTLDNDLRCYARAEHAYGAGKRKKHVVVTALGTGVGVAAVADGQVLYGSRGLTSESSGAVANPFDAAAGARAVKWDEALGGAGIMRRHRKRGGTERFPSEIWTASSRAARITLKETARLLGMHLARLVVTFDPEVIAVGGGIMHANLLREAKRYAKAYCSYPLPRIVAVRCKDAGIVGAALLG